MRDETDLTNHDIRLGQRIYVLCPLPLHAAFFRSSLRKSTALSSLFYHIAPQFALISHPVIHHLESSFAKVKDPTAAQLHQRLITINLPPRHNIPLIHRLRPCDLKPHSSLPSPSSHLSPSASPHKSSTSPVLYLPSPARLLPATPSPTTPETQGGDSTCSSVSTKWTTTGGTAQNAIPQTA